MNKTTLPLPLPKAVALIAALVAIGTSLNAQALFYEGFNYTPATTLGGQGGWTADAGNLTVAASSLSFGGLVTTGGSAGVGSGSNTLRINTGLTTPSSGVRWVSFLMIQTNGVTNFQAQDLVLGDTAGNQMIRIGNPGATSPNSLVMGTGGSYNFFNSGSPASFNTGATSATTTATFFALKYDYDLVSISFYYNPTPGASEGSLTALGSISATSNNLALIHMNLGRILLRTNNIYAGSVSFDELRIGNSFADVAPIPEPSAAAALAGAGILGFAALRRRRRAGA